jgi:hypothetical protein
MNPLSNPISPNTERIAGVAIALVLGAALVYYGLRSSSTSSSGTIILQAGSMAATIPSTGLTITLPPGGTWLSSGTVGTSTPIVLPSGTVSGTGTLPPITWSLNGVTQTTVLTLTG